MKFCFQLTLGCAFLIFVSACSQIEVKSSGERGIASVGQSKSASKVGHQKVINVHSQSCEAAQKAASESPSTSSLTDAVEICQKATEAFCTALVEKASDADEPGEGRFIATACELTAAYGANLAVNQGHASAQCENAYKTASHSSSTDDVESATDVCTTEQNVACLNQVYKEGDASTGDSHFVGAACQLTAAHGAFMQVTKKK